MVSFGDCSPVMVLVAHPGTGSFCHRVASRVVNALTAVDADASLHDLYAEGFDPVLLPEEAWHTQVDDSTLLTDNADALATSGRATDPMVSRHRLELERAGGLVVIHPDWWGRPPAILSGWLDRVLAPTCRSTNRLQRVLVVNTTDEAIPSADPLGRVWRDGIGPRLPTDQLERIALTGVSTASETQQEVWLAAAERAARWVCGGPR